MARKKYRVDSYSNNHTVHEIKTSQNILHTSYLRIAERVAKNCNAGGGFNGYTPSFFIQRIDYKYDEESR